MNLRQQLKAALDRLAEIAALAKSENRDFTEEEITEVATLSASADALDAQIKAADDAQASITRLVKSGEGRPAPVLDSVTDRTDQALTGSFGDQFVKSAAYQQFRKDHPSGFGQGTPIQFGLIKVGTLRDLGRKANAPTLQAGLDHTQAIRFPMVDLTTPPPITLLDVISRGQMAGQSIEYLQITAVTRNAAIIPNEILPADGTTKPTSGLSTALATASAFTYADGFTVTNMMLADAPALASYMDSQIEFNINAVVEDKLINGSGTGGNPTGILATSGTQAQAFDTDVVTTIRRAIGKVTRIGGTVTGVLVSPDDDEMFDLLKDAEGRYYSGGPWSSGPNTIWGRPRIVCHRLAAGTAIVGNLRTITLLDREGLSVLAFNQHADYAARNLVYVRGELRAAQAIFKPAELAVADLTP
ncbi:phage major capsid protein [Kitasatospora sp. NPDC059646]|uniref:phage major capsid protein n=1 Tax=Kitasatospora sp. NPDC059646 TaxID=3346893 RepID=UPI0036A63330